MCFCIKTKKSRLCLWSLTQSVGRNNTKLKYTKVESFSWEIASKVSQAVESNN